MNRATPHTIPQLWRSGARWIAILVITATFAAHALPAAAQDGSATHTVQAGENLYRIALQYGLTVADLAAANAIADPTRIYVGQVLTIPGAAQPAPELHSAAVNPAPDTSVYHTVRAGETLTRIAQQYNVGWQDIVVANGIGDASHILVGQKLLIPGATVPAEASAPASDSAAPVTDGYDIPDQVAAINPAPAAQDLGIISGETANTAPAADSPAPVTDGYAIPDQVAAVSPAQSVLDLGILPAETLPEQPAQQAAAAPAAASTTNASGERIHVVQAGEHLAAIAAQYGLSYPTLAMANNIGNPNQIYSGQRLVIPAQDYAPGSYVPVSTAPPQAATPTITTGKQIVVDLSDQRVYAYENGNLLQNVSVSTGTAAFPTVQGDYKVYLKYESQTMSGPGYNLPGVPYVMYFYKGYSLHGTYWHSNFGTPMSHGCVNMYTPDAQWLWNWAPIGTPVRVQW